MDGVFEGQVAALADMPRQYQRGVAGGAHHLQVRPGVTVGDDGGRMRQCLGDRVDVGVVDADRDDARVEIVVDEPVGEDVGGVAATGGDQVGEGAADPFFMFRPGHGDQPQHAVLVMAEHRAGHPVPLRAGHRPPLRVGEQSALLCGRCLHDSVPSRGQREERHPAEPVESDVHGAGGDLRVDEVALRL